MIARSSDPSIPEPTKPESPLPTPKEFINRGVAPKKSNYKMLLAGSEGENRVINVTNAKADPQDVKPTKFKKRANDAKSGSKNPKHDSRRKGNTRHNNSASFMRGNAQRFEEGGVLKLQIGGNTPIFRSSSIDGVKTGQNWEKIGGFMKQMASPANLRLANTLFTNQKMMDQLKNADKPTNNDSISLQRIKNQGLSNIQPQLQSIDQQLHNASNPMYSDAKLESARQLSANSLAGQQKQQLYGQLSNQNAQIDASNQQISQQEALQNAQIRQQNIAKQDANKQWLLSNKLGLINSTGSALSNRLLEIEKGKQANLAQERALDEQDLNIQNQELYRTMLNNFQSSWDNKAQAAGKSWSDFYTTLSDVDKKSYDTGKLDFQNDFRKQSLENRRNMLNSHKIGFFSSGGKMSLEEKKELEEEKAKHKSQLESDKAFNKLILESKKDHNKMLTLLSKDVKETIKNILKK